MSQQLFESLLKQADSLTADELIALAERLVEKARHSAAVEHPRRKWRTIRGAARPSLFGEDAQAYISRTRQEADEERERSLRREP
ncbi:MAG: hypothetical protein HZB53_06960 [Chloroflexi bacterium]|nr:hypothetical protein [Chloroflexota bacterium]